STAPRAVAKLKRPPLRPNQKLPTVSTAPRAVAKLKLVLAQGARLADLRLHGSQSRGQIEAPWRAGAAPCPRWTTLVSTAPRAVAKLKHGTPGAAEEAASNPRLHGSQSRGQI